MNNASWSASENSSKALNDATFNSTTTLSTTSSKQTLSPLLVAAVGLVVTSIGGCANSVVLAVLIRARREFGSSVHTLITNQTIIYLFACVVGVITLVVMIAHGYRYNGNEIIDGAICVTLEFGTTKAHKLRERIVDILCILNVLTLK